MTADQAIDTLFAAFSTYWGATSVVTWMNIDFSPEQLSDAERSTGFVRVSFLHADGDVAALGNRYFRRRGNFFVQCFGLEGSGPGPVLALAENAVQFFQAGISGFRVQFPEIVDVGPDTGWYQVNAVAEIEYDVIQN
jgi:hypothetical protein